MDTLLKGVFSTQPRIVPTQSSPVANIPEYTPLSCPLDVLQSCPDIEINSDDLQNNRIGTLHLKFTKCIVILPKAEESVSVTTGSTGLKFMAQHLNSMRNLIVLLASAIDNTLTHMPSPTLFMTLLKKPTTLPEVMLISVKTDLPEVIVYWTKPQSIPTKKDRMRMDPLQPYSTIERIPEMTWSIRIKNLRPSMILSLDTDWKDNVNIAAEYCENCQGILGTLAKISKHVWRTFGPRWHG